ncbi:MAG: oxaloacetate decarboxylase, partial [Hyphomicrobiales bacterium]|nr:oxaloacetate decarboxylase [Hyphomicrobiales bacterium]
MKFENRRRRFRSLLSGDRCVSLASVFDPMSARMAHELQFEAGVLGGSVASMATLGTPDLTGLTLTEFADQIRRICKACDLSLFVDADDGYGNAFNVMRTVEELEMAGVCGLSIEDTKLPLPYGPVEIGGLISLQEGADKMRAALAARSDPNLVIVGRTSAAGGLGMQEAIRRLSAYAETGIDAVFPIGVKTRDQLEMLRTAVDLPMVLHIVADELRDLDYLASQGVRIALQGHATFAAAMKAAYES